MMTRAPHRRRPNMVKGGNAKAKDHGVSLAQIVVAANRGLAAHVRVKRLDKDEERNREGGGSMSKESGCGCVEEREGKTDVLVVENKKRAVHGNAKDHHGCPVRCLAEETARVIDQGVLQCIQLFGGSGAELCRGEGVHVSAVERDLLVNTRERDEDGGKSGEVEGQARYARTGGSSGGGRRG